MIDHGYAMLINDSKSWLEIVKYGWYGLSMVIGGWSWVDKWLMIDG